VSKPGRLTGGGDPPDPFESEDDPAKLAALIPRDGQRHSAPDSRTWEDPTSPSVQRMRAADANAVPGERTPRDPGRRGGSLDPAELARHVPRNP
jgi:hypothetical protein